MKEFFTYRHGSCSSIYILSFWLVDIFSTEIEFCFSGSRTSIIVIDGKSKYGLFVYLLFPSLIVFWTFERTASVQMRVYETWSSPKVLWG